MPPIEPLDESSDYSPFLSPKVSQELRRRALRRLFGLPRFQGTDGLNDYDEDYRRFTALGDMITHEMRRRLEMEVERAHQAADREEDETPPVVVVKKWPGMKPRRRSRMPRSRRHRIPTSVLTAEGIGNARTYPSGRPRDSQWIARLSAADHAQGTEMGPPGFSRRTRMAVSRPFHTQPVSNAQVLCSAA